MISSKAELALYLKQDKYALGYTKKDHFSGAMRSGSLR